MSEPQRQLTAMTCIDCGVDDPYRLCDPCRIRLQTRGLATAHANGWPTVLDAPKPRTRPDLNAVGISDRTVCEDCERPSMAGGRWCLHHFQKRATPRPPAAVCGTQGGYSRHRRQNTPACRACLDANAARHRHRRMSA